MSELELEPDARDLRTLVGNMLGGEQALVGLDEPVIRGLSTVLLERIALARQSGIYFHGARDLYEVLGYNRLVTYREYRAEYLREGLAKRIVDAYPTAICVPGAEVYEDEDTKDDTEFERTWKALDERLGIWSRLQRVHTLASLSTYAVLLIGAPGDLGDELPHGTPDKLLYLQPFSGGGGPGGGDQQDNRSRAMNADATIMSFEIDPQSPRFGLPTTYQLKRTSVSSPLLERPVHWTRIIHVAQGLLGDEIYGSPTLEPVMNLLADLKKVTGGGAEAFWLRAAQKLHVDFDKTMGLASKPGQPVVAGLSEDQRKAFEKKARELQHNIDNVMVTRGATITQLSSATADFKGPADAIVTQIAGTIGIPKRILVGSEAGQLASGQDKDNWNTQVQDRRTSWALPSLVKPLIDRLAQYGYLPTPKAVHVEWPVIEDLTEDEKATFAKDLASVNKEYGSTVFSDDEIRDKCYRLPPIKPSTDDQFRAELAVKLTMANKQMGVTVFTDDEIRKISYGFAPLSDDQKVPIGAPEKISVTAPPEIGSDGQPIAQPEAPASPDAKEPLAATLAALEAAIEEGDSAAVMRILDNPEGINQYSKGGVKEGFHVIEHTSTGIAHHGVFAKRKDAYDKGMSLRRAGHHDTFVHHSDTIKQFDLKIAEAAVA